jgi:hypothetical protein
MEYTPRIRLTLNEDTLERERHADLTEEDDTIIKRNNIEWTPETIGSDAFVRNSEDIYPVKSRSSPKCMFAITKINVNVTISDKNFYFPKGVKVRTSEYPTFIPPGHYKNEIEFNERDLKLCEQGGCSIQGGGNRKTKRKNKGKRKSKGKRSTRK